MCLSESYLTIFAVVPDNVPVITVFANRVALGVVITILKNELDERTPS